MLFFKFIVASLVNDIHNISSGFILQCLTKYTIFPIIVRLFPEPAPATTSVDFSSDNTTLL